MFNITRAGICDFQIMYGPPDPNFVDNWVKGQPESDLHPKSSTAGLTSLDVQIREGDLVTVSGCAGAFIVMRQGYGDYKTMFRVARPWENLRAFATGHWVLMSRVAPAPPELL